MRLTADKTRALQMRRAIVATKPAGTFDAVLPVLEDYCRASVLQDSLSVQAGDSIGLRRFIRLAKLKARIAGALKITNQSRYTPKAAATASASVGSRAGAPWGAVK